MYNIYNYILYSETCLIRPPLYKDHLDMSHNDYGPVF